ncbi:hypothetical protein BGZ68_009128 [Mortierella alpina]|nr:hypothetical protein BGZ68_009128 [Mortierella alpina]
MATDGLQPHSSVQGASTTDQFSHRTYQDSAVEKEIKLRAATALHDHSVLLLHALSMNEDVANEQYGSSSSVTSGLFNPGAASSSSLSFSSHPTGAGSSRIGVPGGSSTAFGFAGGSGHASSSRTTATTTTTTASSTARRSSVPVDEEFGQTYFQGPLSS